MNYISLFIRFGIVSHGQSDFLWRMLGFLYVFGNDGDCGGNVFWFLSFVCIYLSVRAMYAWIV